MHLGCDYTNCDNERSRSPKMEGEEKDTGSFGSKEILETCLEYCRLRGSQFDICPNPLKKERLLECYEQLKKMAFIHNGKAILDIDEDKMKAKLIYWGKYIILFPDKGADLKKIWDFLKDFEIVYFEDEAGGIQICAEENLFDEIQIKDESSALLKLRQLIGKSGERKV